MTARLVGLASGLINVAVVCLSCAALVAFGVGPRGALWHVVGNLCLPMQETFGVPFPCLKVDEKRGFVVIRAPYDETRLLIVPTMRIEGIESSSLKQTANLWLIAWEERNRVASRARRPLEWRDIGMAINSQPMRAQDQLHIHVDCVDERLKQALALHGADISNQWSKLDLRPWADEYIVKAIGVAELDQDLFKLVADQVPGARSRMGLQTIAVVGHVDENGRPGFVVLVNSNGGHAAELLDRQCSNDNS